MKQITGNPFKNTPTNAKIARRPAQVLCVFACVIGAVSAPALENMDADISMVSPDWRVLERNAIVSENLQKSDRPAAVATATNASNSSPVSSKPKSPLPTETDRDETAPESAANPELDVFRRQAGHQAWEVNRTMAERIATAASFDSLELRETLLLAARQAAAEGNHGESLLYYERWRQAASDDPSSPKVLVEQGREYREVGLIRNAMDSFYKAMKEARTLEGGPSPTLKTAQWEAAETSYRVQDWQRARKLFTRFTELYKDENLLLQTAFYRMGDCSRELDDTNQAVIDYQRALAHNESHLFAPAAFFSLLEIFLKRQQDDLAMDTLAKLTESITKMPDPDALYWKRRTGELLFRKRLQNQPQEETFQFLEALRKLDASIAWQEQVEFWKALSHVNAGQWEDADQSFSAPPLSATKELAPAIPPLKYADICKWIVAFHNKLAELPPMPGEKSEMMSNTSFPGENNPPPPAEEGTAPPDAAH
ncbi:MAG: tetratricopeptide repeat protein [Verrucomicrobia bacterium]|nr:tetratricopeptide repeat protein [Verrucomicrobiota bacterium]